MTISVSIAGGLGNQFFQLFAAASSTKADEIIVEYSLGKPNLNKNGSPKVSMWQLPFNVRLINAGKPKLTLQKEFNYLLGTSQSRSHGSTRYFLAKKSRLPASFGLPASVLVSSTKEFIGLLGAPRQRSLHFLGYFQTYHGVYEYARQNRSEIKLRDADSASLTDFTNRVNDDETVFIHSRLGDYAFEKKIGMTGIEYYERCLKLIWELQGPKNVYLFSDEPSRFMSQASSSLKKRIVFVCEPKIPDYLQFEMLRKGKNFVIANSTFSWMGAALSEVEKPTVYVPWPWFVGQEDPIDLIPSTWIEVPR